MKLKLKFFYLIGLLLLTNCKKVEGPQGSTSMIETVVENSGVNCKNGGLKLLFGIDKNKNKVLDEDEITDTRFICNAENGKNSLIISTSEPMGENCEEGGTKIQVGLDNNSNGILDENEITQTRYLCNGINGLNSILNVTNEPAGTNCQNGGYLIQSGNDKNFDGQLNSNEIEITKFVCNGKDGSYDKEIKFDLNSCACSYSENVTINKTSLLDFDIDNYIGVDSVSLIIYNVGTYDGSGHPTTFSSTFELYDITNDRPIDGSLMISDDITNGTYLVSKNLLKNFPKQKISVGIKVTDANNINTISGACYLILTRK